MVVMVTVYMQDGWTTRDQRGKAAINGAPDGEDQHTEYLFFLGGFWFGVES